MKAKELEELLQNERQLFGVREAEVKCQLAAAQNQNKDLCGNSSLLKGM